MSTTALPPAALSPRLRTAVITGAGSGIGLAAALEFARHGWQIGLIGRGEPALRDAEQQVIRAGGRATVALADVADEPALERAAASIEAALGRIDVWVNNAGIGVFGRFTEVPSEMFRRVIEVNLIGVANGTRIALRRMRERDRGTIVQVASAVGHRGVPLQGPYSASKYGIRGLTESIRTDLLNERSRVHVTMVHPPAVNTPFYAHAGSVMDQSPRPVPPVYQPELIGEAIYRAATERRREWFVGGQSLLLSTANKIIPGALDRFAALTGVWAQKTRRKEVSQARDPSTFTASTRAAGMHGQWDRESRSRSLTWSLVRAPAALPLAVGIFCLLALRTQTARR